MVKSNFLDTTFQES